MALNVNWVQGLLSYTHDLSAPDNEPGIYTDSGYVGRAWIDGALVVYDPEDCPAWLAEVLTQRDEDGNTGAERVEGIWDRA
jgi:hypothetical protein